MNTELQKEIAKVEQEIFEMSNSSYSQSNPSHVLGLRALKRKRDRLIEQLRDSKESKKNP
jgi:hypothetical protein